MASDEELARHVAQLEDATKTDTSALQEELDEYKSVAGEIHDELARRIESVDEHAADEATLADVVDRLDRLEARLDDLDDRVQD
ncbi:MAG: CRP-like cAMP-binding protein [Natronomonas sp.]|jgi:CRP-like cAMP-binding protein|uniref:hypothetical protein n=1 Tax=Natronomonas sp. TaxID=2184060 RepID=UPI003988CA11